jgi:polyhydroxybutyrate depolymerase
MKHKYLKYMLLFGAILNVSCSLTGEGENSDETIVIRHQDRDRRVQVHFPEGLDEPTKVPLVIAFHGARDSGHNFQQGTGFNRLADRHDFVVAYPTAFGANWAEGCDCVRPDIDGVDDVGFAEAIVERLDSTGMIDQDRVYVIGYSQGGIFAHHLACERSDMIAGVAVYSGLMSKVVSRKCDPDDTIDMFMAHGTADRVLPYSGIESGISSLLSAVATLEKWASLNGCFQRLEERSITFLSADLTVHSGQSCDDASRVQLVEWEGGTHSWPRREIRIEDQMIAFFGLDS